MNSSGFHAGAALGFYPQKWILSSSVYYNFKNKIDKTLILRCKGQGCNELYGLNKGRNGGKDQRAEEQAAGGEASAKKSRQQMCAAFQGKTRSRGAQPAPAGSPSGAQSPEKQNCAGVAPPFDAQEG